MVSFILEALRRVGVCRKYGCLAWMHYMVVSEDSFDWRYVKQTLEAGQMRTCAGFEQGKGPSLLCAPEGVPRTSVYTCKGVELDVRSRPLHALKHIPRSDKTYTGKVT